MGRRRSEAQQTLRESHLRWEFLSAPFQQNPNKTLPRIQGNTKQGTENSIIAFKMLRTES